MMFRVSKPFGHRWHRHCCYQCRGPSAGDLAGKLQQKPVYQLIAPGPRADLHLRHRRRRRLVPRTGFQSLQTPCQYGPADGLWGLDQNERRVAEVRELVGDDCELMLDCYMAFDVEYSVRPSRAPQTLQVALAGRVPDPRRRQKPHQTQRVPALANAGQRRALLHALPLPTDDRAPRPRHTATRYPRVGGLTACIKICHMAEAAGLEVCLHGGGRDPYGQHLTWAIAQHALGRILHRLRSGHPTGGSSRAGALVPKDSYLEFAPHGPGFDLGI